MTYDKSLVEVWKWKEEVSASLKELSIKERLETLRESAQKRQNKRSKTTSSFTVSSDQLAIQVR